MSKAIEEIRVGKQQLEKSIQELMSKFKSEYGLSVTEITIIIEEALSCEGSQVFTSLKNVSLEEL
jgi:hypothetical protein